MAKRRSDSRRTTAEGFVWRPFASSYVAYIMFFLIRIFPLFFFTISMIANERLPRAGRWSTFLRCREGNLMFRAAVNGCFYCRSLLFSANGKKNLCLPQVLFCLRNCLKSKDNGCKFKGRGRIREHHKSINLNLSVLKWVNHSLIIVKKITSIDRRSPFLSMTYANTLEDAECNAVLFKGRREML